MLFHYIYDSPIGKLTIIENCNFITSIVFGKKNIPKDSTFLETKLIKKCFLELEEYFNGIRKEFTIPTFLVGTPFQKKVWLALKNIPYGETRSYKDIAILIGSPKASRAIGNANNKNPIPIIYPCHRVIGKNGKLVGYAAGLDKKIFLLNLENNNKI